MSHSHYHSVSDPNLEKAGPVPAAPAKTSRKGIWIAVGALVVIAIAVGVGVGVSQSNKKSDGGSGGGNSPQGAASSAIDAKTSVGRFATATQSMYLMPEYPSTVSFFGCVCCAGFY